MPANAPSSDLVSLDVDKAGFYLAGLPGVRRVWLFGSAGRGRSPDWRSDLDFALEGLAVDLLCETWSELDQLCALPVDLVRWEDASPTLRAEIQKGIILHAA